MSTGDTVKKAGQYSMVAGGVTLFIMAASATVIFDIIFIMALYRQANQAADRQNHNPVGAGINFAATYFMWNLVSKNTHPLVLFLLSPLVSIAAIILAVALDVSYIAWWIGGGWAVGAALMLGGYGLYKLGQYLNNERPQIVEPEPENSSYFSRVLRGCGLFQEKIEMLPWVTTATPVPEEIPLAHATYACE